MLAGDSAAFFSRKLAPLGAALTNTPLDMSPETMSPEDEHYAAGCFLLRAIAANDAKAMAQLLKERPSLNNFADHDRRTPLHVAASTSKASRQRLGSSNPWLDPRFRLQFYPLDDQWRIMQWSYFGFDSPKSDAFVCTTYCRQIVCMAHPVMLAVCRVY